jgi:hypothetical protein
MRSNPGSRIFRVKLRLCPQAGPGLNTRCSIDWENWGGSIIERLEHLRIWTLSSSKQYTLGLGIPVALHRPGDEANGRSRCGKSFNFSESRIDLWQQPHDSRRLGCTSYQCSSTDTRSSRGAVSKKKTRRLSQFLSSPGRFYQFRSPFRKPT